MIASRAYFQQWGAARGADDASFHLVDELEDGGATPPCRSHLRQQARSMSSSLSIMMLAEGDVESGPDSHRELVGARRGLPQALAMEAAPPSTMEWERGARGRERERGARGRATWRAAVAR